MNYLHEVTFRCARTSPCSVLRVLRLVAAVSVAGAGFALASAPALAGTSRTLSLHYSRGQGSGVGILHILAPGSSRKVRVAWGDGRTTIVTRWCAKSSRSRSTLVVPHRYVASGRYRITARLTRVGCHAMRATALRSRVLLARVAGPGPAAHSAAVSASSADQWVSFGQSYPLAAPTYQMVQGSVKADGSCALPTVPLSLAQPKSVPAALEEDEISVDPSRCEALMEIGSPPATAIVAPPGPGSTSGTAVAVPSSTTASAARATSTGPIAHAAAVWESAGYWHTWYHDPANIHVNDVWDYVHWRWNGGCTTETAPGGNYASWSYFPDGWFVSYNGGTYFSRDCNHADTSTYIQFENAVFCALTDTYTVYDPNHVDGYYNGSLGGGTYHSDTGLCTGLLTFQAQLVYTENKVYIHP